MHREASWPKGLSAIPARYEQAAAPLFVDLDGTLVRTDLLWECVLRLLKRWPWMLLAFPVWLLRGKAAFKRAVMRGVELDVTLIPYHPDVLAFLHAEHEGGREIVLATAAERSVAEAVARHLGLFRAVLASDGRKNLSGENKLQAIVHYAGERGFDYLGNSWADLPIWIKARQAHLVYSNARLFRVVGKVARVGRVFADRCTTWKAVSSAIRMHHWAKNLLLFVPMLLAHRTAEPRLWLATSMGFLAFSLCASGLYILNDLLDLDDDRRHATKRCRPFASGAIPLTSGLLLAPVLPLAGLGVAFFSAGGALVSMLLLYVIAAMLYSFWIKRVVLLDVLWLTGLYVARVFAGAVAAGVPISHWFLAFSLFFFVSLALVKRYIELRLRACTEDHQFGRGYASQDVFLLANVGPTTGYLSLLVLSLYINSPDVASLYRQPDWLWLLDPLLFYWITRLWLITQRGKMKDDPLVFALTDRASYAVGAMVILMIFLATLWP